MHLGWPYVDHELTIGWPSFWVSGWHEDMWLSIKTRCLNKGTKGLRVLIAKLVHKSMYYTCYGYDHDGWGSSLSNAKWFHDLLTRIWSNLDDRSILGQVKRLRIEIKD